MYTKYMYSINVWGCAEILPTEEFMTPVKVRKVRLNTDIAPYCSHPSTYCSVCVVSSSKKLCSLLFIPTLMYSGDEVPIYFVNLKV